MVIFNFGESNPRAPAYSFFFFFFFLSSLSYHVTVAWSITKWVTIFHHVTVIFSITREGTIFISLRYHGQKREREQFFVTNTFSSRSGGSVFHTSTFHESCNIFCYKYIFRTVKSRVLVILRNFTSEILRDVTFFPEHFPRNICHVLSYPILRWGRPLQC